ncbi:MAG TPA: hypothetical protein VIF09_01070 [Polyangiaceae bacterium]|jgi:hypothetical protein
MKTTILAVLLVASTFLVGGCAAGLGGGDYTADTSTPAAVDTSWVDAQRAADQQQAAQVQQTVDNQHMWDQIYAQQAAQQQAISDQITQQAQQTAQMLQQMP